MARKIGCNSKPKKNINNVNRQITLFENTTVTNGYLKIFIIGLFLLIFGAERVFGGGGASINFIGLGGTSTYCCPTNISAQITAGGMGTNNTKPLVFTIELSNIGGVFPANPTILATFSNTNEHWYFPATYGTITGTIPCSLALGAYKVRIHVTGGDGNQNTYSTISFDIVIGASANAGPDQSICSGGTATLAGSIGGVASAIWSGGAGSFTPNNTTLNAVYTPTAAEIAAGSVTLTLTTVGGACGTGQDQMVITITHPPTATISYSGNPLCIAVSTPQSVTLNGTGGYTVGTYSGAPAGLNITASTGAITPSASTAGSYTVTYTVPASGGCSAVSATTPVVISALNKITLSSAAATINQTICISSAITKITYTTTGATGATFTNLPAGVSGSWASNVVTINGTPTVAGTFGYTVTLTGGCGTITASGTIKVNANTILLSSAAGTNNQTKCINTAITNITYTTTGATGATFSGLPAGVTGSWVANKVTISGTPTASGIFNYVVTLTGGCGTITAAGTITVTANVGSPVFALGASSNWCKGAGTATYTATATSASGITYSLDAASITGGNTINASTGVVTYVATWNGPSTITASAAGCSGPRTATHTVTVKAIPVTSVITGNQTPNCSAIGVTYNVTLTSGSSYSWTVPTGATITAGATGPNNNQITVKFGTTNGNVTVTETNLSLCVGTTKILPISLAGCALNPDFTGIPLTICIGSSVTFTSISTGTTGSTTYSWSFGSGATPATANTIGPHSVVYSTSGSKTVSLTLTDGATKTTTKTNYITVSPDVTIAPFSSATSVRCESAGTVITTTTANNNSSAIIYGLDAATDAFAGNSIDAASGAVTYAADWKGPTIITASAAGCNGPATTTHGVTTNQAATVNAGTPQSVCAGGTVTLAGTIGGSATGATWSAPSGSFSNLNSLTSTYTPSIYGGTITLTLTSNDPDGAGPCNSASSTVDITVNPAVIIDPQPADQTDCQGNTVVFSAAYSAESDVTYQWQSSINGGTTWSNIIGASGTSTASPIELTLTNIGVGGINLNQTRYRIIISDTNGCSATSSSALLTVNANPSISPISNTACNGAAFSVTPVNGTNGIVPFGTTYSWSAPAVTVGLTGGAASIGSQSSINGTLNNPTNTTQTASYTVTPASGSCIGSPFAVTVTVFGNLAAGISGGASPICFNGSPGTLTASGGGGTGFYSYQWYSDSGIISGATTSTYSPGNLTATTGYYCAITSGSCGTVNTATSTITVYDILEADISGGSSPICYNTAPGTLTASGYGGTGSYTYQWYSTSGIISGATNSTFAPGNLIATTGYYCAITSGSCGTANSATTTITVNPKPSITAMTATACSGTAFTVTPVDGTNGAVPAGTTYSWGLPSGTGFIGGGTGTGATSISGTLTNSTSGQVTATYTIIPTSGTCAGNSFTLTVTLPAPLIAGGHNINPVTSCAGYNPPQLDINVPATSGSLPPYTYQWFLNGSPVGTNSLSYDPPQILTAGIFNYNATVTDACGSSASTATKTITIVDDPIVGISGGGNICINNSLILTGSITGGTGIMNYQWQSGPASSGPWTDIPGATSSTYSTSTSALGTIYYQVKISPNVASCNNTSSVVWVKVNPLPALFNVTGGGSYCAGGTGVAFGLDGSESGVNYQLQLGGSNTGGSVAGTGAALSFGLLTTAGTYTVIATNPITGCTLPMTGSQTITINPLPTTSPIYHR